MKNKIKKILLLGMTAMFTAGAAGTAVISCPVWQMKQNKTLRLQKSQKQKMQLWKKKLLIRQMIKQKIQI